MYIQFAGECPKCQRAFKAEAVAPAPGAGTGRHRCECPRCHTTVPLDDGSGVVVAIQLGWALPAAPWPAEIVRA